VCGGHLGEGESNFGCTPFTGDELKRGIGYEFRYEDIALDPQKTKLYACILDETASKTFCDSRPLPVRGSASELSLDLTKHSKMPLPAHFSQVRDGPNIYAEEDSNSGSNPNSNSDSNSNSGSSNDNDDNNNDDNDSRRHPSDNPYCDVVRQTGEPYESCFDRKDYSESTGLYPCRDGSDVKDWRDCPDGPEAQAQEEKEDLP
jgi:hypothetical protein